MKPIDIDNIKVFKDRVMVTDIEFGDQIRKSGFIIPDDDGKAHGVKARWAKVLKVGPDQKELAPGLHVLLEHGRWTRAVPVIVDGIETKMFMIDYPRAVLIVSEKKPLELGMVGK